MIRILLADDHTLFREGLKQIFSDTNDIVVEGEASSGQEVVENVMKKKYDAVVLDISMPGMNGLEVLKKLKNQNSNIPILILSMYSEEQYAVRVFRAGADGYVTKTQASKELIDAIRKVAEGGKYVSDTVAEKLVVSLDPGLEHPNYEKLSDREYQVMILIASGKTVKEIANELQLRVSTVSTLRSRILKKLNLKNNAQIMHYAIEEKLIE